MDASDYNTLARELLQLACLSPKGRAFSDPIYQAVVEGRQDRALKAGQFYSSCGDLAHWLLYRLGVRLPWVNRDEHTGWRYLGATNNVTSIVARPMGTNAIARVPTPTTQFEAGDILVLNLATPATTHVTCVMGHDGSTLHSGDYGQPHGALRTRALATRDGTLFLGDRSVGSWLRLRSVIDAARSTGQLDEPESVADYVERFARATTRITAPNTPSLRLGSVGADVRDWQRTIGVRADGVFGPITETATIAWQSRHGLVADGIVGPRTRAASRRREAGT